MKGLILIRLSYPWLPIDNETIGKGSFFQENETFPSKMIDIFIFPYNCRISLNISCHSLGVIVSLKLVIQLKCSCTIVFIHHLHVFQCQIVYFRLKGFITGKHVYYEALGTNKFTLLLTYFVVSFITKYP